MSYCSKCGAFLEESQQFCSNCGAQIIYGEQPFEQQPSTDSFTPEEIAIQYPMKWFNFLIYFSLFFSAFICAVFGLNYITGGIYFSQTNGQVSADMVYGMYGNGLKVLDVLYGVITLAAAGFSIYTRFRLSKYKVNGPLCLYILYGSGATLALIYSIGVTVVTGMNQVFTPTNIVSIITSVVVLLLNIKYFQKRGTLFVN